MSLLIALLGVTLLNAGGFASADQGGCNAYTAELGAVGSCSSDSNVIALAGMLVASESLIVLDDQGGCTVNNGACDSEQRSLAAAVLDDYDTNLARFDLSSTVFAIASTPICVSGGNSNCDGALVCVSGGNSNCDGAALCVSGNDSNCVGANCISGDDSTCPAGCHMLGADHCSRNNWDAVGLDTLSWSCSTASCNGGEGSIANLYITDATEPGDDRVRPQATRNAGSYTSVTFRSLL